MAKKQNRDEKEYWYMRLRERLFGDREITEIEALPESKFGLNFPYLVEVLYMKLMCFSIRDEGEIVFYLEREENMELDESIVKRFFPLEKRAQVKQGLIILENLGLIQISRDIETTKLFIPEVYNMTGRSSKHADDQRKLERASKVKEIEDDRSSYCRHFSKAGNVYLTEGEYERLEAYAESQSIDLERLIENLSISKLAGTCEEVDDYTACCRSLGIFLPIKRQN